MTGLIVILLIVGGYALAGFIFELADDIKRAKAETPKIRKPDRK